MEWRRLEAPATNKPQGHHQLKLDKIKKKVEEINKMVVKYKKMKIPVKINLKLREKQIIIQVEL